MHGSSSMGFGGLGKLLGFRLGAALIQQRIGKVPTEAIEQLYRSRHAVSLNPEP